MSKRFDELTELDDRAKPDYLPCENVGAAGAFLVFVVALFLSAAIIELVFR